MSSTNVVSMLLLRVSKWHLKHRYARATVLYRDFM